MDHVWRLRECLLCCGKNCVEVHLVQLQNKHLQNRDIMELILKSDSDAHSLEDKHIVHGPETDTDIGDTGNHYERNNINL